jgi:peptidylprolyl isomerase
MLVILYISDTSDIKTRADGVDVPESDLDPKLPKVTLADNGAPSIEFPENFVAPQDLVSQTLKVGNGKEIGLNDTISFAYSAWRTDGSKVESTWDSNRQATFSLSVTSDGWKKGLAGAKIGSQVLLIVPPSMMVPAAADSTNSSTIFVIDILDILQ